MSTLTNLVPDTAPEQSNIASEITDKRGFAARWKFSVRHIDNLLMQGMPHCKIGKRRVRIFITEGDRWMVEQYGVRRIGKENARRGEHQ
jgi:hypothetical protein